MSMTHSEPVSQGDRELAASLKMALFQFMYMSPSCAWKTQPLIFIFSLEKLVAFKLKFRAICPVAGCSCVWYPQKKRERDPSKELKPGKREDRRVGQSPSIYLKAHIEDRHPEIFATCHYFGPHQDDVLQSMLAKIGRTFRKEEWINMSLTALAWELNNYKAQVFEQFAPVGRIIIR